MLESDNAIVTLTLLVKQIPLKLTLIKSIFIVNINQGEPMNFREFDNLIHSGAKEIVLDSDVILDYGEGSEYLDGICLDVDDLIIDGNGHTVDACGKTRIFTVSGSNIELKNIEFIRGCGQKKGGAILCSCAKLKISNSGFQDNESDVGGAIFNENGTLEINDSVFQNNGSDAGGAILNDDGTLSINGSTFEGNASNSMMGSRGGAIHNNARLNISKSIFCDNIGEFCGGAIFNEGNLHIDDSRFFRNRVEGMGGAIYNDQQATLNISGCELSDNSVKWYGGEIYYNKDVWYMTRPRGFDNWAEGSGGAIYNKGSLIINDSEMSHNMARQWGGAIRNRGDVEISDSFITFNEAEQWGGAIDNSGSLKILNCLISSNTSQENIIINEDSMQVHSTDFNENSSKRIILNEKDSSLSLINARFQDNSAEESVIYNGGKSGIIEKSIFKNDSAPQSIINLTDLTLINLKMEHVDNPMLNHGHALIKKSEKSIESMIQGTGEVEFYEDIIPSDDRFDFGYLDSMIHEGNAAEIILEDDISFGAYEKDFYEGGIELDIDGLTIDGNGRLIDGGDMSRIFIITAKNVTLKNITFKNGHSHRNYDNPLNDCGGALRINGNVDLTIENCRFLNNKSERNGGAIHNNGRLNIKGSVFKSNMSKSGGAINNCGRMEITECMLYQNMANGNGSEGGAIFNYKGQLSLSSCQLLDNTSVLGGAISTYEAQLSICDSILSVNLSKQDGGAVCGYDSDLNIVRSKFFHNMTRDRGAAIFGEVCRLNVVESDFVNHRGRDGVIFDDLYGRLSESDVMIRDSVFRGNVERKSRFFGNGDLKDYIITGTRED